MTRPIRTTLCSGLAARNRRISALAASVNRKVSQPEAPAIDSRLAGRGANVLSMMVPGEISESERRDKVRSIGGFHTGSAVAGRLVVADDHTVADEDAVTDDDTVADDDTVTDQNAVRQQNAVRDDYAVADYHAGIS